MGKNFCPNSGKFGCGFMKKDMFMYIYFVFTKIPLF